MVITSIALEGFCGFSDFSVDFGPITVLTGPNNGGKTTILRAVDMVLMTLQLPEMKTAKEQLVQRANHHAANAERRPNKPTPPFDPVVTMSIPQVLTQEKIESCQWLLNARSSRKPAVAALTIADGETQYVVEAAFSGTHSVSLRVAANGQALSEVRSIVEALDRLASVKCRFLKPLGWVVAGEQALSWGQYSSAIHERSPEEIWRNTLHWLFDGQPPLEQQKVVEIVKDFIDGVEIRPPARTREGQSKVACMYEEAGSELDITMAGAGTRTALYMAAATELGHDDILLIDEPGAHLHPSVQRKLAAYLARAGEGGKQVLVVTHSPDMIGALPAEAILWIDKSDTCARSCGSIGEVLVGLGALDRATALQLRGKELVFVEDGIDEAIVRALALKCEKPDLFANSFFVRLKGAGNAAHLASYMVVAGLVEKERPRMVGIVDSDYHSMRPGGHQPDAGDPVIRLPCKEIENLLILAPETLHACVELAARARRTATHEECTCPTIEQVRNKIAELASAEGINATVRPQWIAAYYRAKSITCPDGGQIKTAEEEYAKVWADADFRLRSCPGSRVLRSFRTWLQTEYKLTLAATQKLFTQYAPPKEIRDLFDAVASRLGASSPKGAAVAAPQTQSAGSGQPAVADASESPPDRAKGQQ